MPLSSSGIGSGLDVNSLVAQLVSAERSPQANRLQATQSRINVNLSALGTFTAGLSQLQSAVEALAGSGSAVGRLGATLSREGLFTAATASGAVAGRYEVEVLSRASAHKMASQAYAGGADSVVGNGSVTVGMGAQSFQVQLVDGANTLAELRDRINAASDNPGVRASLLTEDGGTRLLLTSGQTGTAQSLSLASTADGGGDLLNFVDTHPATDARVRIDGFMHTDGDNTITGALDGVTLNLLAAEPGTVVDLDIRADHAAAAEAIQLLVRNYNAVVGVVKRQAGYDPASQTGGPLMGDVAVRTAMQQLRSVMGGAHGGGEVNLLAQLGITTSSDGTLTVDSTALSGALAQDPDGVRAMFSASDGMAARMSTVLDRFLGSDGRLGAQTERLRQRLESIGDQTEALDRRMAAVEARYRRQFVALDALVGQMQTTSNYLAQQLANLPGASRT